MAFEIDKAEAARAKKLEGEWRKAPRTGVELLVFPRYHPQVKTKVHAIERKVRQEFGLIGRLSNEPLTAKPGALEEFLLKVYSEAAVGDWKGVALEGAPIAFSASACRRAMEASEDFMADVADLLNIVSEEEQDTREAVSGN